MSVSYRLITTGNNQRREYFSLNRSALFQALPDKNLAQEQRLSYDNFLNKKLNIILNLLLPSRLRDYNNEVKTSIGEVEFQDPEVNEEEAIDNSLTWSNRIFFELIIDWNFQKVQLKLLVEITEVGDSNYSIGEIITYQQIKKVNQSLEAEKKKLILFKFTDLKETIIKWIKNSFKIAKFTCEKKQFSPKASKDLLIQTKKQLQELFPNYRHQQEEKKYENTFWYLTSKIKALEEDNYQEWEIKEQPEKLIKKNSNRNKRKKENKEAEDRKLKINLEILDRKESEIILASFRCRQKKKVGLCRLPKMTPRGTFIINGHEKVVIFQSIRAPSIYFFTEKKDVRKKSEIYGEIIPLTGPWISIFYDRGEKNLQDIKLKFLNSEIEINLIEIFQAFSIPFNLLEILFSSEELNVENYRKKPEPSKKGLLNFLSTTKNSQFDIGKLGRKKINQKMSIYYQLKNQLLAENLYDEKKEIILKKNTLLDEKKLRVLQTALNNKRIISISIPYSTNDLYAIKVKSPKFPEKVITVVGINKELSESKTYFDLADLICFASAYINLHHGIGEINKEKEKDSLENQIIRTIGDLMYNIFDTKLGIIFRNIENKYLGYISQLKRVDLAKIPDLKILDDEIKKFFNSVALVQLQNQNNPLAEASYVRKLSVLGLGGFSSSNTTLSARNISSSYYGNYDLVETPEGQKVGLIHNLTIGAKINDYGQLIAPYYKVCKGIVLPQLVYLSNEDLLNKYVTHPNIKINKGGKIIEKKVITRYQEEFLKVPREKVDYIDSSFYHLNSATSSFIPFFHHNDATRMLMASNMQRQAITLLKSEEPLVSSGIEASLLKTSSFTIEAEEKGTVEYVDSQQIIIRNDKATRKVYNLKQSIVSNKNALNFSKLLVKKGDLVKKGEIIACENCFINGELSLGYNLRVAYLCWNGYNYEDAIVISERLLKEDIFTSFFAKKHVIVRRNTKKGPEIFTLSPQHFEKKQTSHLNQEGIVKIGSKVKGGDILVCKLTPQFTYYKESLEELLLMNILGTKSRKFVDDSLYLPKGEEGIVYKIKRKSELKNKDELELIEVYIAHKRKIKPGDKLTTRFGNKGVVAKIVPEIDMPFDEEGKTIDIIFNPLSIPTRMNIGQLLETIIAHAAYKKNNKILVRPFNTLSLEAIKEIIQEAKIENWGSQKMFDGRTGEAFHHNIYNGYIYVIKLNHMVVDKFHARNTGPYSLIYQQPLKGRAQEGGQRVGEMEVWALEAHGATYNLMEIMSAKSDDIRKRKEIRNCLLFDDRQVDLRSSQSESFNLLLQHLRGIGFDLQAIDHKGQEVDFYEAFSGRKKET